MRFHLALFLLLASFQATLSQDIEHGSLLVDGAQAKAQTGDNFICATIDWWPHDKCDYNHCPWGYSSVVNLDLSHPFLAKAIQALKPLRIRLGGSLQDQVVYDVGSLKSPCHPFQKVKGGLFGFSKGCLHMKRWDELNQFFNETGAIVTFGLNVLHGKHQITHNVWEGAWDHTNTYDFIKYTISKGYKIDSWELGNELSGKGIGASVGVAQYGRDLIKLKQILDMLYDNIKFKPSLVAPGGFYDKQWYDKLLQVSGSGIINVLTHHLYNLGPEIRLSLPSPRLSTKLPKDIYTSSDEHLERKILDPERLNKVKSIFSNLSETIQKYGPWSSAWVGEAGGAYNSGGNHVSNTFLNSFWYLDQLGMASTYSTKVYCRQTLIGGNYGLLNTTTFTPNPDYYSALLWHRLMGKKVLAVSSDISSPFLRTYAHCSKDRAGVTLLLINLSNQTHFILGVRNPVTASVENEVVTSIHKESSFFDKLKKAFSWVGTKGSEVTFREEYHLTPKDGYLRSQTIVLNGIPLELTNSGDIPRLDPVQNNVQSPIYMAPLSIAFIVYPNFDAPACARLRKL
ncbi:heparanase-like protein 1 isoform X3 [Cajanus cajan]|nr:heparanase-like protein 1 isoform X3 [Cajanus cajan]XP_029129269.1 heparanase-like protein 1 isoform X3 [Cajanus cajan]XP_029129270.1 heparanase-like protein 1 isoform X3 [Cajanus cajan]XP_029129271.1 heparanase-like protein 1 isoform X3 [Cajanus cajan]XP_029129272.1 heparanase-like protein 1 isoform X3 [Cajanus cajan]